MPMFEYRCRDCGEVQTIFTSFAQSERENITCGNPDCDSQDRMVKLPSAPNFSINGYSAKNGYSR